MNNDKTNSSQYASDEITEGGIINDLTAKKCVACEGGMPALNAKEIAMLQERFSEPWEVVGDKKIQKNFTFKDFKEALSFTDQIGLLAEEEGHHPDIHLSYGKVKVELWTHAVNGLSENDFILAAKIDTLISNS